jgi:hypothetical protein
MNLGFLATPFAPLRDRKNSGHLAQSKRFLGTTHNPDRLRILRNRRANVGKMHRSESRFHPRSTLLCRSSERIADEVMPVDVGEVRLAVELAVKRHASPWVAKVSFDGNVDRPGYAHHTGRLAAPIEIRPHVSATLAADLTVKRSSLFGQPKIIRLELLFFVVIAIVLVIVLRRVLRG